MRFSDTDPFETHRLINDDLHITGQGNKEFEQLVDEIIAERKSEA